MLASISISGALLPIAFISSTSATFFLWLLELGSAFGLVYKRMGYCVNYDVYRMRNNGFQ